MVNLSAPQKHTIESCTIIPINDYNEIQKLVALSICVDFM